MEKKTKFSGTILPMSGIADLTPEAKVHPLPLNCRPTSHYMLLRYTRTSMLHECNAIDRRQNI